MPYAIVFLFFLLKHIMASNIWDIGYSYARRKDRPRWWLAHLRQVSLELAISSPIYLIFNSHVLTAGLVVEAAALTVSCLLERIASYRWMVAFHLLAELLAIFIYSLLTMVVVRLWIT